MSIATLILPTLILVSALACILWKNPVLSALSLVVTLISLAVLYFQLDAPFVGILQVVVYAGAIMVLFIFVIMLINLKDDELEPVEWNFGKLALTALAGAFILGITGLFLCPCAARTFKALESADFGSLKLIGTTLFQDYLFSFELVSFVLLVAIIGAVLLTRRGEKS